MSVDSASGAIYAGGFSYRTDASGNASTGFAIVRYHPDGAVDGTFGTNGVTFTGAPAFVNSPSEAACLTALHLLPNGKLMAVGVVASQPTVNSAGTAAPAQVVLAEYDTSTGLLDNSYGKAGTVATPVQYQSDYLADPSDVLLYNGIGDSGFAQELGAFDFVGNKVVASVRTAGGWELARLVGDDGVAADAGTLDPTFGSGGTLLVAPDAPNWIFSPANMPSAVAVTPDGIVAAGELIGINQYGGGPAEVPNDPQAGQAMVPVVVRYDDSTPPAAVNLATSQKPNGNVTLTWSVAGVGQDGYRVERSNSLTADGSALANPTLLASVGPTQTDFVDSTVAAGATYYYQVVPFTASAGPAVLGTATNIAAVTTLPTPPASGFALQQTVTVPIDGSAVATTAPLQAGQKYLLVASGLIHLNADTLGDAAYWYAAADPHNENNQTLSDAGAAAARYGVGVGRTDGSGTFDVPNWGLADFDHHTYTIEVTGQGVPLSLSLQEPAGSHGAAHVASGDAALQVAIYAEQPGPVPPPVAVPPPPPPPVRAITTLETNADGTAPLLDASTPIDVLSASPVGLPAPWALWLVSATGARTLLASGTNPAGALPGTGAAVATLDPASYPDGAYTVQLTSSLADPADTVVDNRPVRLATAVKAGALVLPVTDATLNTLTGPMAVTRTYDSSQVSVSPPVARGPGPGAPNPESLPSDPAAPNFGPGWAFDLLDSQLTVTSGADTADPTVATPALRAGDLVSLTVPDGGRHVFEFTPVPVYPSTADAASATSLWYRPEFTAVDGSGATLAITYSSFPSSSNFNGNPDQIEFQPGTNEFGYSGVGDSSMYDNSYLLGINPARPYDTNSYGALTFGFIGGAYQFTVKDGTSYSVDAATGAIKSVTNPSGAGTTYTYAADGSSVTAKDQSGRTLLTILASNNRVTSIQVPGQTAIQYGYDGAGNLATVQNQSGARTLYSYQSSAGPHLLSGVTNAAGKTALQAVYSPTNGQLNAIITAAGLRVPVTSGQLGSGRVMQTVVDAAGDVTQDVYDERLGNLLRKIQTVTDNAGNVLDYVVTATGYTYVTDDVADMSARQASGEQVLQSVQTYAPFEVVGSDPAGLRYSQQPGASSWTAQAVFDTTTNIDDAGRGQVTSASQRTTSDGVLQTTLYGDYAVVNAALGLVKPQVVTVEQRTPDTLSGTGYDDQVRSTTYVAYDASGNELYSVTPVARNVPGGGVDAKTLPGGYTDSLYVTFAGLSDGAANGPQTLRWNPSIHGYQWTGPTVGDAVQLVLLDASAASRGSGATPVQGDAWSLQFADPNGRNRDGLIGQASGLSFDGSPLGLSTLLASFLGGQNFRDQSTGQLLSGSGAGIGMTVPGWVAQGSQNLYTSGGDAPAGLAYQAQEVTAIIAPDGTVGSIAVLSTNAQKGYYGANDYYANVPGQSYGQTKYAFDAAGQETYFAYDQAGHALLQYVYKTWTDGTGGPVSGWVGTTNVYDSASRLTDTYQATYRDPTASGPQAPWSVHTLPVVAGGPAGVQVDTSACPVYTAPLRTKHTDYNALGRVADTIDQYGGMTAYTYDASGNAVEQDNPDGTIQRTVYDALNRPVWRTNAYAPNDPSTAVATRTVYDSLGNAVETDTYTSTVISIGTQQLGSAAAAQATLASAGTLVSATKTSYDPAGRPIETVSPSGLRTGTVYTPDGKTLFTGPLKDSAPDGGRQVTADGVSSLAYLPSDFASDTRTDPSAYDPALGLFYTTTTDQDGHATRAYTDALGRTVRTEYADGSFGETLYGVGTTPVTVDQEGDAIATPAGWPGIPAGGYEQVSIAQRKAGDAPVATLDLYDAAGRLTDVWLQAVADADPGSPTFGQSVRPHWHYAYDAAGNETSQTSPTGHTASGQYAAGGNTTAFGYDQNGNQVRQRLPDGQVQTWTFNQYQQVAAHTDFDGNTATYTYAPSGPEAGLLQSVAYAGAPGSGKATQTVGYTYDDLNRQSTVTDASGTTTSHYDVQGNLIESDTPEGVIRYGFDPATGNHVETSTDSTDILYGYDPQGRLVTVTVTKLNGVTLSTPLVTTYSYDPAGNKLTETLPDGELTAYAYDVLNRLTGLTEQQGGTTLFGQSYVLNPDGTRASSHAIQQQPDGRTVALDSAWAYDADGRLTQETVTSSNASESFSNAFSYDLDNNRAKSVHAGPGAGASETITSAYGGNDELLAQTSSLSGATTNGYDANGSLTTSTTAGQAAAYTYDARNKMVGYAANGTTATYAYDDAGDRVQETVNGTTTLYLTDTQNPTRYDQPAEAKASANAAPTTTYLVGDCVFGQADAAGNASYLLADGHGSTQQLTTSTGTVAATFRYDAFGTPVNFTPSSAPTVFLFGGDAVYDPASGLYLHGDGVRPTRGFLFTQRDTYAGNVLDPISFHKYLYANGDPINTSDPSGHMGLLDPLLAAGDEASAAVEEEGLAGGAWGEANSLVADIEAEQLGELTQEAITMAEGQASGGSFGVIGSYPGYINVAKTLGAVFFNLPDTLYAAGGQIANQAFIRASIASGVTFILSTPPEEAGPGLQMEIQMLLRAGYQFTQTGLGITLAPPGGG